jgi:hypothetical protein
MKDVIVAASFSYSYEQLYPFLRSIKDTGFDGEILLFIGKTSIETQNRLRADGVKMVPFIYPFKKMKKMRNPLYRLWPVARHLFRHIDNAESMARWTLPFHNLVFLRFVLYYRYLLSKPHQYRNVFLTDLRDVTFQGNPFAFVEPGKIRCYVEEPVRTLGECPINSRWLQEYFGDEVLKQLADKPISCSGSMLGDYASIMTYLERFVLTLRLAKDIMRGADQGVHNYLAYIDLASMVTLCPNRESEVLTMGLMPKEEVFPRNERGDLIDSRGVPYAVLHQFDRFEELRKDIMARYQKTA